MALAGISDPAAAQAGSAGIADAGDVRVVWRVKRSNRVIAPQASTVAVIDTGANIAHQDLAGKIVAGAWSAFNDAGTITDTVGHGTHVASVVAASRSGVPSVYIPNVLPVQVFSGSTTSTASVTAGLQYSIGRAPIANMSLSSTAAFGEGTFRDAVSAGMLIVAAAGNSGAANPEWPARYAREAWANNQIIAVGAVDGTNTIASFSNRAGDTANNYLVAPGVNIYGAYAFDNTSHALMTGTSAAAPQVSAAAAIVRAYWPYLSATQIANILFNTATDLGAPGVDAIYGRGLLNLTRALEPVGTLSVPLSSGRSVPVSGVGLNPGVATGAAIRTAAASGAMLGIGLDSFGRQFYTDYGRGVTIAPKLTIDQMFGSADRQLAFAQSTLASGGRLVYALDTAVGGNLGALYNYDRRDRSENALAGFSFTQPLAHGQEFSIGVLGFAHTFFGLGGALNEDGAPSVASPALANPYFNLVASHSHVGFGSLLGDGLKLKYGVLTSGGSDSMLTQFGLVAKPSTQATIGVLELAKTGSLGMLGISVNHLRESQSYLGSNSGEAFALRSQPGTTVFSMQGAWRFAPAWALAGHYTVGQTAALPGTSDSLIGAVSSTRTESFALGLVRDTAWKEGDRLSLTASQPLRVNSGSLTLDMPTDVDALGNVLRTAQRIDLRATARERLTDLTYFRPLDRSTGISLSVMYRLHPNHDALAPPERIAAVRLSKAF